MQPVFQRLWRPALDDPIEEIAGGEIEKLRIVGVIEVEVLRRIPSQPSPRAKSRTPDCAFSW